MAAAAGFVILLGDAQESGRIERETLECLIPVVEGVLIGSSRMPDSALRMVAKQRPTVVLNRQMSELPCVVRDNPRGVALALDHLAALGHEHITYLAGPEASWADWIRWQSVRDVASTWGLSTQRIGPFPPTFDGGRRAAAQVQRPTAVVAYNDLMAMGLITALTEAGVRVPDDVSVLGFDNIPAARLVHPALTTIAAPLGFMGEAGARALIALLDGAQHCNATGLVLPVHLMVRGSTGPRRRRRVPAAPRGQGNAQSVATGAPRPDHARAFRGALVGAGGGTASRG